MKKCIELCNKNGNGGDSKSHVIKKNTQELDDLISQLDRSNTASKADEDNLTTNLSDAPERLDEDLTCREGIHQMAPCVSSDDYGESSDDSSGSEASSVSSKEPLEHHSIDLLFERLQLDHSDDLIAAVDAMNGGGGGCGGGGSGGGGGGKTQASAGALERDNTMPTFEWELPPESTFNLGSLDRNFTLNSHDLLYAHKYVNMRSNDLSNDHNDEAVADSNARDSLTSVCNRSVGEVSVN